MKNCGRNLRSTSRKKKGSLRRKKKKNFARLSEGAKEVRAQGTKRGSRDVGKRTADQFFSFFSEERGSGTLSATEEGETGMWNPTREKKKTRDRHPRQRNKPGYTKGVRLCPVKKSRPPMGSDSKRREHGSASKEGPTRGFSCTSKLKRRTSGQEGKDGESIVKAVREQKTSATNRLTEKKKGLFREGWDAQDQGRKIEPSATKSVP